MTPTRSHQKAAPPFSTMSSWRRSRGGAGPGVCLLWHPEVCGFEPCLPSVLQSSTERQRETEKKKENNLTPNLFKGSQRPDVPCFLPAAAAVAIACGCGLSVWSSDVRDWNSTGNSPQLGGCSSAAAPDSRACKDPVLSQSQRLCFCWARVADVQKRCSALKI